MKAATSSRVRSTVSYIISIHAAREGGDKIFNFRFPIYDISIHAAREGGDDTISSFLLSILFQSTPPVKAATIPAIAISVMRLFQSTPPVKAATIEKHCSPMRIAISIHAAREGGDL